ncbi:hypothetical protein DY000_02039452 [Brassica cretica]|uniref:Uncharacterized protein n=1 Tax=Brassica cretica TaxID=69181 RepID=A0ABQ7B6R3_BRACR|nr:hypothetical protein DY000_02039452 [Brassica cretica]
MALFIMKWMDFSLKECGMQDLSFLRASPQDAFPAPRASASEIELDAIIGEGRLVDPSRFTSSLEVEFVYLLTQMQDLYLLNDGGYAFHTILLGSVDGSGEHTSRIVPFYLRCLCFEVSIFAPNIIVGTWLRTVLGLPCDYVGGAQIGQVVEDCLLVFRNKRCSDSGTSELVLHLIGKSSLLYEILWGRFCVNLP